VKLLSQQILWLLALVPLAVPQDSMSSAIRPGHTVLFPLVRPLPVNSEKIFQDRFIRIEFVIFTRFAFRLTNQSTAGLEIDWDRASYVDPQGSAHRVIHQGTRFIERDRAQAPSILPSGSSIEDALVPADHIEFADGKWKIREPFRLTEITEPGGFFQGGTFRLLIPVKAGTTKKTYDFTFSIPKDLVRPK
jgi:hypothetical protein